MPFKQKIAEDLASDGLGGAFVVWEDNRNSFSTDLDIYAQYVDKDGAAQWTDGGLIYAPPAR